MINVNPREINPDFFGRLFDGTKIEIYSVKYLFGEDIEQVKMLYIRPNFKTDILDFDSIFSAMQYKRELETKFGQEVVEKELQEIEEKTNTNWEHSLRQLGFKV